MLEDFEENTDETDAKMRTREIERRLRRAAATETIQHMVERYFEYNQPIDKEGYITG